jgi:hypothetical protein
MSSPSKASWRTLSFGSIGTHGNLRCDAKYRLFWGVNNDQLFLGSSNPSYPLSYGLVSLRERQLSAGQLEQEYELIELEDVEKRTGAVLNVTKVDELKSAKLVFGEADLVTTRLRPYLGKTIENDKSRRLIGTTEWVPLKVDPQRLHPTILKYILLSPEFVENAERLLSGKEHPRLAATDLASLKVPFVAATQQTRAVAQIKEIEAQIERTRSTLRDEQASIDEILCEEFGFPLAAHNGRARESYFSKGLHALASGFTLRNSSRYNHPSFESITDFFSTVPSVRVKRILACPIYLGATAKQGDFIDDGDAYFVHPGATKRQGIIDPEDCHQVDATFYEQCRRRAGLIPGDVIINRSGEAYGKVAYFKSDIRAVASDFTMRVRVSKEFNSRFVWYFFRSVMFQAQIRREMRGASVNNIFPPQVEQMHIVASSRARQDSIAARIERELEVRESALRTLSEKYAEIQAILRSALGA